MSAALLLVTSALLAPEPPPPPDPDADEELIIEDDEEPADSEAPEPEASSEDEADEETEADGEDEPAVPAPKASPAKPTPAVIPTEGQSKPPPSDEALRRDDPLAQPDTRPRDRAGRPGSPQRFALEFKMGPSLPNIDRAYSGAGLGPYATIFGQTDSTGAAIDQPKQFPMPVLAFEWQFLYLAGPLGLGTQIGMFRDKADALVANPSDGNLRSQADDPKFAVIPVALLASYRFELLADRFRVPLVPYLKAGLAYAFFWNTSGSGNLARNSQGDVARGGVPGWQLNAGAMFRLDVLEPGTAKKLDSLTGINHTYVFGEYQLSRIANFGVGQVLDLGDNTWFAGLAIEF